MKFPPFHCVIGAIVRDVFHRVYQNIINVYILELSFDLCGVLRRRMRQNLNQDVGIVVL